MKYIWLSHVIDNNTPLYGGKKDGIRIEPDKSIAAGDSCNTSLIRMPAHAGTHVDAPRHFVADGLAIDGLGAESWVFKRPVVVKVPASPGQIIQPVDFMEQVPEEMDACFFKTGFEQHRQNDVYWKKGPGIAPETAGFLKDRFPGLKAIGMDFISISSLTDRETGRQAHRAFLEKDILIIEDMKLGELEDGPVLAEVVCLPLRFVNGDGAPCTILGILDY
jgi:arylformamidase